MSTLIRWALFPFILLVAMVASGVLIGLFAVGWAYPKLPPVDALVRIEDDVAQLLQGERVVDPQGEGRHEQQQGNGETLEPPEFEPGKQLHDRRASPEWRDQL